MNVLIAAGIPSAIVGFCFWLLEHRLTRREEEDKESRAKRQAEIDKREARREQFEYHVLQSVSASMELSEATAKAVQRIPDAHCNGDMTAALDYAEKVKESQKEFMYKQGIKSIL